MDKKYALALLHRKRGRGRPTKEMSRKLAQARKLLKDKKIVKKVKKTSISVNAKRVLKKIYEFSSARGFRLGLNAQYAGSPEVVSELITNGMVGYRRKYGNYYLIPSLKGRKIISKPRRNP